MNILLNAAFIALLVTLGDALDFAIERLRLKDSATDLWVLASDASWDNRSLAAAFQFAEHYLDRVFGTRLFSTRSVTICVITAFVTSEPGIIVSFQGGHNNALLYIISPSINAISDLFTMALARRIIRGIVRRGTQIYSWPILGLFFLSYYAIGLSLWGWLINVIGLSRFEGYPYLVASGRNEIGAWATLIFLGPINYALLWLPIIVQMHTTFKYVIFLCMPGAFTTLILLIAFVTPYLFIRSRWLSKPIVIWILGHVASIPSWTGRAIGLVLSFLLDAINIVGHKS